MFVNEQFHFKLVPKRGKMCIVLLMTHQHFSLTAFWVSTDLKSSPKYPQIRHNHYLPHNPSATTNCRPHSYNIQNMNIQMFSSLSSCPKDISLGRKLNLYISKNIYTLFNIINFISYNPRLAECVLFSNTNRTFGRFAIR